MKVSLVSKSEYLHGLCAEVLADILGADGVLLTEKSFTTAANLCLWDFEPGQTELPDRLDADRLPRCFFLIKRKHLPLLRERFGAHQPNVILKPVSRPALRASLAETCRRWKDRSGDFGVIRRERDDMLQCLIEANLKLQEYDQERTNFLARAIHDFRAPLTALSGYCGLLLAEQLGEVSAEQKEVLERMQRSARRLAQMASGMFQLSVCHRVESKLNLQKHDIRECIEQAVHEIAPFTDEKRITVSVEIESAPDLLAFERDQLEQVLINLLDNACKFTPRAGRIEVRGYPFFWERRSGRDGAARTRDRRAEPVNAPNAFRVDVRDSGPGIPAAHLNDIFEEYISYGGGQDRSGGGLGLAICKMVLNQHHGSVWAESNASGAAFSFVLPYQTAESPQWVKANGNPGEGVFCAGAA